MSRVLSFRVIIPLATIDVVLVIVYIVLGGYAGNNKYDIIVYFMVVLSAMTIVLTATRCCHEYSEFKAIQAARQARQAAIAAEAIAAEAAVISGVQDREGYINGNPAPEIIEIEGAPGCKK